uniref:Uncharacterized protein n=1 Tax=Sphaerodactylus townsendi TaxID=933632 RepID=A0ACB8EK62_9SAUR
MCSQGMLTYFPASHAQLYMIATHSILHFMVAERLIIDWGGGSLLTKEKVTCLLPRLHLKEQEGDKITKVVLRTFVLTHVETVSPGTRLALVSNYSVPIL